MSEVKIKMPKKLVPIFLGPADVRGAYGGRGSGKTRTFAKMLAARGYMYGQEGIKGQLLCARQFMNSLEDSSLEECKRAIEEEPFLLDYYEIGEKYIKSKDGRIWFSFAGLDRNVGSVKSKGRILICWIDEAEPVTEYAFSILEPTLREEGEDWNAELWLTWNPESKSSPVTRLYRNSDDPLTKIAEINWRDNPYFPDKLDRKRLKDLKERPEQYENIWEGAFGTPEGSILGRLVQAARKEGRIHKDVMFDLMGAPLEVSCDLGHRDTCSWWFWQRTVGGFRVLYYTGASGMDAQDWIPVIRDTACLLTGIQKEDKDAANLLKKKLGKIWMPHDARAKTFLSKHSAIEQFGEAFGFDKVGIAEAKKADQINAARTVIKRCEFNSVLCDEGIDGLEAWKFKFYPELNVFSKEPEHDWASHPSDAFAYGALKMEESIEKQKDKPPQFAVEGKNGRIVTAPLNELWKDVQQRNNRI